MGRESKGLARHYRDSQTEIKPAAFFYQRSLAKASKAARDSPLASLRPG
jgi:hypothetical protein